MLRREFLLWCFGSVGSLTLLGTKRKPPHQPRHLSVSRPRHTVWKDERIKVNGNRTATCGEDEFVILGYLRDPEMGYVDLLETKWRRRYEVSAPALWSGKARRSNLRFVYDLDGNPAAWTLPE